MAKLYEIRWPYSGPDADKKAYALFRLSLKPNVPIFLYEHELPVPYWQISGVKDITIKEVPEHIVAKTTLPKENLAAQAVGNRGVVWVGTSAVRQNQQGTFQRNVPRFDLDAATVEYLGGLPGFKVVI